MNQNILIIKTPRFLCYSSTLVFLVDVSKLLSQELLTFCLSFVYGHRQWRIRQANKCTEKSLSTFVICGDC
jgi:hypothetical protein